MPRRVESTGGDGLTGPAPAIPQKGVTAGSDQAYGDLGGKAAL
jgi:hypothetical protein